MWHPVFIIFETKPFSTDSCVLFKSNEHKSDFQDKYIEKICEMNLAMYSGLISKMDKCEGKLRPNIPEWDHLLN